MSQTYILALLLLIFVVSMMCVNSSMRHKLSEVKPESKDSPLFRGTMPLMPKVMVEFGPEGEVKVTTEDGKGVLMPTTTARQRNDVGRPTTPIMATSHDDKVGEEETPLEELERRPRRQALFGKEQGDFPAFSEANPGFFCGDSIAKCGGWFNKWLNWRLFVDVNDVYAQLKGETGVTELQELEYTRHQRELEFHREKYERSKALLDLQFEQIQREIEFENERQTTRMEIAREMVRIQKEAERAHIDQSLVTDTF